MRDQILELNRYNAMRRVAENLLQARRLEPDFSKVVADMVSSWLGPDGEAILSRFIDRVAKLDRYEARQISRRGKALRALDALHAPKAADR